MCNFENLYLLFCRLAVVAIELRPVCGHGARQKSGQWPHGIDVLLAQHTTVQPDCSQGQKTGRKRTKEHHKSNASAQTAHHHDETHMSQFVDHCAGNTMVDRSIRFGALVLPRHQIKTTIDNQCSKRYYYNTIYLRCYRTNLKQIKNDNT